MTTKHQYLEKYPISIDSERLIVGTIHPHKHEEFDIDFFYGNKKSIWTILSEAFPDNFDKPLTLKSILKYLKLNKISVSDTIIECDRINESANDKDLTAIKYNRKILDEIKESKIAEILFTSGFGKNNAFKLFYVDILEKKITQEIIQNREVILGKEIFGREIKLTILYSPSGSANIGLSKSKLYLAKKGEYEESKTPVQDFKIDYYRDKFKK
jgi:G:T/U-mismatch repair DNA glycosylase